MIARTPFIGTIESADTDILVKTTRSKSVV